MPAPEKDPGFNPAKAEAFAEKFLNVLNHGSLCVMASIGHRTGFFVNAGSAPGSRKMTAGRAVMPSLPWRA